ncbi:MAG: aspartate 4-decarboxylase [Deltaproteobacteria bacterium HGW-Deltaproteobacteria-9]|nr:MAG: aspartate 4-decarboxylase [Deltaproteobacteria bacterium HGW-Deltaproteobacteria-9]
MRKSFMRLLPVGLALHFVLLCVGGGLAAEVRPLSDRERKEFALLSPFEFKNVLGDAARSAGKPVYNAGRGNPNFINTRVRLAFSMLHRFAVNQVWAGKTVGDLSFPIKVVDGSARRFQDYLHVQKNTESAAFLMACLKYAQQNLGIAPDDFVAQMTAAILGDHYPVPSRMLTVPEKVVEAYLKVLHFPPGKIPSSRFNLFATEGGTAAMNYTFKTLKENFLIGAGDKIALITPIFSPYIEIPVLNDFELQPIYVSASESSGWQVPDGELNKLKDPDIKALFLVNPMNPGAVSMNRESVDKIASLIRTSRPDLIVLTDTVYSPFVDEFHDVIQAVPENCIGVFSYSKYMGVTGWRLGVIFVQEENIFDKMIRNLPKEKKELLRKRYITVTPDPNAIPFIERLLIDSRDVALAHTGGLSTPQQAIMTLFSLYDMLDTEKAYKKSIQALLQKRISLLYGAMGAPAPHGPTQTAYYKMVNLHDLAARLHDPEFAAYLTGKFTPFDLLMHLARAYQTVLLPGVGFAGPDWTVRVSLANLPDDNYTIIGNNLVATIRDFHAYWKQAKTK